MQVSPSATPAVTVVGGGLAGCEAALQLAGRGMRVNLIEMRPSLMTPVHKTGALAELVCSNSLKSTRPDSAAGLLKDELAMLGSKLIECASRTQVPAGGALAVDRGDFSACVTALINADPLIDVVCEEARELPQGPAIVAAGPMASDALCASLTRELGAESLSFYDAAAPIVEADTIDMQKVFRQSRYDKGEASYLNAPMDKAEYDDFITELLNAKRVIAKDFERKELFQACQPVEEVARTGRDALRFGALKPVGLKDPATGKRPWAAVQLRAENRAATAYNLVGFQTNLTWPEQQRVFRMIPGLEGAEFSRYGVMHKNTFIDSPHLLTSTFAMPKRPTLRFAGQITGTEGYCEAMASGLFAALCTYADLTGAKAPQLPAQTAFGSLVAYATDPQTESYQPMHVNFGIFEPLPSKIRSKRDRYAAYADRSLKALARFVEDREDLKIKPTAWRAG